MTTATITTTSDIEVFAIPRDVWRCVIGNHLDAFSLFRCTLVCKTFREMFPANLKANWTLFLMDAMHYPELSTALLQYLCNAAHRDRVLFLATSMERIDIVRWLFSYSETWEELGQLIYFPPKISASRPGDAHLRRHVLGAALRIAVKHRRYELLDYAATEFNELPSIGALREIVRGDYVELFFHIIEKYASRIESSLRGGADYQATSLRGFYDDLLRSAEQTLRIFPVLSALRDSTAH
jgi:hypothetical protein